MDDGEVDDDEGRGGREGVGGAPGVAGARADVWESGAHFVWALDDRVLLVFMGGAGVVDDDVAAVVNGRGGWGGSTGGCGAPRA